MRIFNKLLGSMFVFLAALILFSSNNAFAIDENTNQKTVLVISDRVEKANAQYLIYPQVSETVAADVINELNLSGEITAPALSTVRDILRSPEYIRSANKLLYDYRYKYELNYDALKKIAKNFNTKNVLLVTGSLDTTRDFLKPTWWSFLNIPGENKVKTEYRMYTYVALVDLNNETITWENMYHRQITAPEFGLANATYSPDLRQFDKIKKGAKVIARDAAYRVESVLAPEFAAKKAPPSAHERVKFNIKKKHEDYIQNINSKRAEKEQINQEKNIQSVEFLTPQTEEDNTNLNNINLPSSIKSNAIEPAAEAEECNIQISPHSIIIPKM